jgi:hypothetical protein
MITLFENFLNIGKPSFNPNIDWYCWITPENKIIKVSEYGHISYMRKLHPGLNPNKLYEKAYEDNWVRVAYIAYDTKLCGELSITAGTQERIKKVLRSIFYSFLHEGDKDVIISWGFDRESLIQNFLVFTNNMKKAIKGPRPMIYIWDWARQS